MNVLGYFKILLPCMILALGSACDDDDLDMYDNDPKLYFFKGNYNYGEVYQPADSIVYSFRTAMPGITQDTVHIWAWIMGFPSDEDRAYALEQVITGGADEAVAGRHFVPFDDAAYANLLVVPAHAEKFRVPVIVLKDASLDEKEVRLEIRFKANQNFKTGIDEQQHFAICFSNLMSKPANWDRSWRYSFGEWSSDKMEFVIKYLGITDFDNPSTDVGEWNYLKALAIQKLLEHPDEYPGLSFD